MPTVHGLNNVTIANKQLGLPEFDKSMLWRLANCTQKSGDIVDFTPIVFKGVNSSDVYITPVPARETWITAELLKNIEESGFDIKNHPEMFLGLNGKIVTNAWCAFDNPFGISYTEKQVSNRTITPADPGFLDLVKLQWNLYSQFVPQRNGSELLYNRDFPWYNSTELKKLYPDKNEMKAALFNLFYLPAGTYSIKDGKRIYGIEGARVSLTDADNEYKNIVGLYPNGKVYAWGKDRDIRAFYYTWLADRSEHELINTVKKYVGNLTSDAIWNIILNNDNFNEIFENNYNGLDQFLTKKFEYWNLVKFITGYERWNPKVYESEVGEMEGINHVMPEVLRIAGFPVNHINIEPTPSGAANREWTVGLPPYIVQSMNKYFPNSRITLVPGYGFGLHSCEDGLIKDGIKETYVLLGDKSLYLMKND